MSTRKIFFRDDVFAGVLVVCFESKVLKNQHYITYRSVPYIIVTASKAKRGIFRTLDSVVPRAEHAGNNVYENVYR